MKIVCRYDRQQRPTLWRDAIRADDWAGQLDDIPTAEATVHEYLRETQLLWIKDNPGKEKTMLFCGIIGELQNRGIEPCYFFCQATNPRLNSGTAVLLGLGMYDQAGTALFQDANSWVVSSQLFTELLEYPSLEGRGLMIDALDECQTDLERLLDLTIGESANYHAKWKIRSSLELHDKSVAEAVSLYIYHKAAQLEVQKDWMWKRNKSLQRAVENGSAQTTSIKKMAEFPFDLEHLYGSMMQQIRESEDSVLCENILRLVAVVYRPVTLAELASLLELEEGISGEDLKEDFLLKDKAFISKIRSQHNSLFSTLDILTGTLRRDVYNLRYRGGLIKEHTPSHDQAVLKHANYSCIYLGGPSQSRHVVAAPGLPALDDIIARWICRDPSQGRWPGTLSRFAVDDLEALLA
ncbi:hypothetical protein CCMA1212_008736 [Trichoderma ghanense]|uniref:Nephrocystin 3-like N-terminal domain-containing protein n=1 Tax=Trichoderma ghanense TaxID=65468 RepID=A0ABY2GUJ0_9HYPO